MSKALVGNKDLDLSEYQIQSKNYLKSAQDSRDEVISLAQQQMTETLALRRQEMQASDELDEKWYEKQAEQAQKDYNNAVENANKKYADTSAIIANGYKERATELQKYQEQQVIADEEAEKENAKHNVNLKNLEEKFNRDIFDIRAQYGNDTSQFNSAYSELEQRYNDDVEEENSRHKTVLTKNYEDLSKTMSDEAMEQLGVWMGMLQDTEMYGGKISNKDKDFVDSALDQISRLPGESKNLMKDTVQGMVDGLDENEHLLYEKAGNIVGGFINNVRKILGINSPSRVMRNIFGYVGDGAVQGLNDSTKNIKVSSEKLATSVIKGINNIIGKQDAPSFDVLANIDTSALDDINKLLNINMPTFSTSQTPALNNQNVSTSTRNDNRILITVNIDSISSEFGGDISKLVNTVKSEISLGIDRRMRAWSFE